MIYTHSPNNQPAQGVNWGTAHHGPEVPFPQVMLGFGKLFSHLLRFLQCFGEAGLSHRVDWFPWWASNMAGKRGRIVYMTHHDTSLTSSASSAFSCVLIPLKQFV